MDAAELKAMQAPLKDAYRDDAGKAVITLRAKGSVDDQKIACKGPLPWPACIRQPAEVGWSYAPAICCSRRWWRAQA